VHIQPDTPPLRLRLHRPPPLQRSPP
jgi:hypothetical protein